MTAPLDPPTSPGADRPAPLAMVRDRWCHRRALDNPLRRWLAPARREVDRLAVPTSTTVADVGTGVGYYVPELLRQVGPNGRLWIVDPDPVNLRRAGDRAPGDRRVTAWVGSAARLTAVPDDSVDRVLLSLVLCCIVDKEGAMDEAWRILRPGGRVLVSYPERRGRIRRTSRSLRVTPERWRALLARHPWRTYRADSGWIIRRHLLEKAPSPTGSPP